MNATRQVDLRRLLACLACEFDLLQEDIEKSLPRQLVRTIPANILFVLQSAISFAAGTLSRLIAVLVERWAVREERLVVLGVGVLHQPKLGIASNPSAVQRIHWFLPLADLAHQSFDGVRSGRNLEPSTACSANVTIDGSHRRKIPCSLC